jgi:hypothetical protein
MRATRTVPRAGRDPIDGAGPALAMIHLTVDQPLRDQTIALLLDADRCGLTALVVQDTHEPDHVLDVASTIAEAARHGGELAAVVLASVRVSTYPTQPFPEPDDVDRWLDLSELISEAGVELLEWFVIDPTGVWCPRDLLGEPPRW